jgi:transposase
VKRVGWPIRTAIRTAIDELTDNKRHLASLVSTVSPALLDRPGVGPVSGAQAIVSWSHRGRCRNDAAFAAQAGSSPIPASSGRTVRHRLNRGGDRQLNRALHDITRTRWRADPRTHTYIAREAGNRGVATTPFARVHRGLISLIWVEITAG